MPRPIATLALIALLAAAWLATAAWAQGGSSGRPTVRVERGEREIVVTQGAIGTEGARTVLANRNCEAGILSNIFFGPRPEYVLTQIDDTELISQIAVVRIPEKPSSEVANEGSGEGGSTSGEGGDEETIELYGGALRFDRPGCIEQWLASGDAGAGAVPVVLLQGRTRVEGGRFFLDRGTDIALMDGPISLVREPEEGSTAEPLRATSRSMTYDLTSEASTLLGDVVVTSGERVTTAERLELDEEASLALLFGSPALSRRGDDEVRGNTLRYDLDTDEVVAVGSISASLTVNFGSDDDSD
jgi:lipopolysaccharide export system protein LptA